VEERRNVSVKCEEYNHVCVLTIDGDFAGDEVASARASAENLIENRQIVQFVVDFEKSGFVDSEGLEALLWLKRQCEDRFGQLKLAALDENLKKILEITRLEPRFECHADLTSALKTMR
jgi:anti-anti-sigma factor